MTHYDITMDNDIARDIHCDVTMRNDFALCVHIMSEKYILMLLEDPFYYLLLCPIMILPFPQ